MNLPGHRKEILKNWQAWLKEELDRRGRGSRASLAAGIGITRQQLNGLLSGNSLPTDSTHEKIYAWLQKNM